MERPPNIKLKTLNTLNFLMEFNVNNLILIPNQMFVLHNFTVDLLEMFVKISYRIEYSLE